MSSDRKPRRRAFPALVGVVLLTSSLALGLTACGKKGEPLPPVRIVPRPATDLAVRQRGGEVLFDVAYPQTTIAGLTMPPLESVEVMRLLVPAPSPGSPVTPPDKRAYTGGAEVIETVSGEGLAAVTEGDRLRLRLQLPTEAAESRQAYVYAVRFTAEGGEPSDVSNLVALVPLAPPPSPESLEAEATAEGVRIRWEDGEEVGGYRIYRRLSEERSYAQPLGTAPADATDYLDRSARYGERYIYAVTAVGAENPTLESPLAAEREVDYQDRFAPPPPEGLVALGEEGGRIRLAWEVSTTPDAAGYHVYRRAGTSGDFTRLTERPVEANRYLAQGLTPGAVYTFRVTAVDQRGNESATSREVTATAP